MSKKPITLAFAGNADIDIDNVKALLNDFVGLGEEDKDGYPEPSEREVNLIFPLTKDHLSDGIEQVLAWSEYADLPYTAVTTKTKSRAVDKHLKDAETVEIADNVTAKTVDLLREAEGDVFVILLWGEDGGAQAELLLDAAEQAGIKAKDLSDGLDDIAFSKEEPTPDPEAEKEDEPEDEQPRRGRRRRSEPEPAPEESKPGRGRRRRSEPEEALPEEKPLTEDEPEQPKQEDKPRRRAEPEETPAEEEPTQVSLALIRVALESAYTVLRLEDERNAVITQTDVRERPLTELLRKALHTLGDNPAKVEGYEALAAQQSAEKEQGDQEEPPATRRRRGRPRDESKTYAYLEDEDGNLTRRRRGRVPAGSKIVYLTREEIEEKGLPLESGE